MSSSPPTRPSGTWSLVAARALTALLAAMALAQAVLAGSFLDGHAASLDPHLMIGMAMVAVAVLLAILSGIGLAQGLPRRMLVSASLVAVVLAVQVYAGMAGMVGLHVPLGVLLVAGIAMQTVQAFRPVARRPADSVPADVG